MFIGGGVSVECVKCACALRHPSHTYRATSSATLPIHECAKPPMPNWPLMSAYGSRLGCTRTAKVTALLVVLCVMYSEIARALFRMSIDDRWNSYAGAAGYN